MIHLLALSCLFARPSLSGRESVWLFFGFLFLLPFNVKAQVDLDVRISGSFQDISVIEFLQVMENRHGATFYYHPSRIPYYKQSFEFDQTPLWQAIGSFLEGSNLDVIKYGDRGIVLASKHGITREEIESLIAKWKEGEFQKPILSEPLIVDVQIGERKTGQKEVTLQGVVRDAYTQESIIGCVLQLEDSGLGTTSDEDGKYELNLAPGKHKLLLSNLGYRPVSINLSIFEDGRYDIALEVQALNLTEVVVEASENQDKVSEIQLGVEAISMREIRELPSFLGEADVIKSLERLPGVSTAGEASSGFNVRGGNIDQNLVLLDDAILFNASHVLGLFSIFNPDAIRNVSLYKGSIPAQYGGRLSSVLAVNFKSGDKNHWHGSGGVGLASSRLVLDGPLIKGKTTAVLGLRSSYSSWMLKLLRDDNVRESRVFFGDLLAKIDHKINEKQTLSASGYLSYDYFQFSSDFGYNWQSILGTLNWRFLIKEDMSLTNHLSTGSYESEQFSPGGFSAFRIGNGIRYWKDKVNFSLQKDAHFANFGIEGIRYGMQAEKLSPFDESSFIDPLELGKNQGIEISGYINDEFDWSEHIGLAVGLRFSQFISLGPATRRIYDPLKPRTSSTVVEEIQIDKGKKEASFSGLEPRIAINFRLNPERSIKISYNRLFQYIHLISNTASPTPIDIWQLSTSNILPQNSHNWAFGIFQNLGESMTFSLEGFYKQINNLPVFRDLPELLLNPYLDAEILASEGKTYGGELLIEKKEGRWTGNIAYTYSRSLARTDSEFSENQVNGGEWFPSSFDQPHQLTLDLRHQVNPVQSFQINFTYKTGRPITVPIAGYAQDGIVVTHFSDRNVFRVPAYHRLDFGYNVDKSQSKLKGMRHSFSFSLYNLYSRKNPFSIFFRRDSRNIQRSYRLSVLASAFPSLTWNFSF